MNIWWHLDPKDKPVHEMPKDEMKQTTFPVKKQKGALTWLLLVQYPPKLILSLSSIQIFLQIVKEPKEKRNGKYKGKRKYIPCTT